MAPTMKFLFGARPCSRAIITGRRWSAPVNASGWFATGDLGSLDEDGYLRMQGRKDSMFISGGENIQPEEIESVLLQTGLLSQAMVVPQDHAEYGQVPVAFIAPLKPGDATPLAERLLNQLSMTLPKYKIPVAFYPWTENDPGLGIKLRRRYFQELVNENSIPGSGNR